MKAALMTVNAKRNQVIGMIALVFCPIKDMMHVKLDGFLARHTAQSTPLLVPPDNELANCDPSLAPILCATAFPVWRFIASHAIGWIFLTRSSAQHFHGFWGRTVAWIQFGVIASILEKAILVTEYASSMRSLAAILRAAVRAGYNNTVTFFSKLATALNRTGERLVIWLRIQLMEIPKRNGFALTAVLANVGDSFHLTPPECRLRVMSVGHTARSAVFVNG